MHTLQLKSPLAATERRRSARAVALPLLRWYKDCLDRADQRRQLAALDERLLKDIGIGFIEQRNESCKPFWRP